MSEFDASDLHSMETIAEYGHQVIGVFAPAAEVDSAEYQDFVPFAYTVGRTLKSRPELLITGPFPPQVAQMILNNAAAFDDEAPFADGMDLPPDSILGGGMPVRIVAADPIAAEMNQALHLFRDSTVTALQVLWPDKNGRLPGDPQCEIPDGLQPQFPPSRH